MTAQYNINVNEAELNTIMQALGDRPYKQVSTIIIKLAQQYQEQRALSQATAGNSTETGSDSGESHKGG